MPRYATGEPIPPELLTAAGLNRLMDTIADLRAVLAPQLDHPWHFVGLGWRCAWCGRYWTTPELETSEHWGGCPTYRRDALLGRDGG